MSTSNSDHEGDEAALEGILRGVGARQTPSPATAGEVFAAAHAAWQTALMRRAAVRRRMVWAAAAGVAAVAVGAAVLFKIAPSMQSSEPQQIASVVRVDGQLQALGLEARWASRAAGENLTIGETAATTNNSRAALGFRDGLSVRLDHGTRVEFLAENRVRLHTGALYVDAPPIPGVRHDRLTVETATASIQHLGTQYSVRTVVDGLEVGVREGHVRINGSGGVHTGNPGEKLHLTNAGQLTRTPLPSDDAEWQWASQIAPPFDINGQTLAAFLEWVARETGRKLVYASPAARAAANEVRLHGAIKGLDLNAALNAVLSTTKLRQYNAGDKSIGITLGAIGQAAASPVK